MSDPCGDLFHCGAVYKKTTLNAFSLSIQALASMCSDTLAIAEHPQKLHKYLQMVNCKYQVKYYQLYLTSLNNFPYEKSGGKIWNVFLLFILRKYLYCMLQTK